jgi:hypothetical protein
MPAPCPSNVLVSCKVSSLVLMARHLVPFFSHNVSFTVLVRIGRRQPLTTTSRPFMPISGLLPVPSMYLVSCKVSLSGDGGGVWLLVTHDVSSPSGSDRLLSAPFGMLHCPLYHELVFFKVS